MADGLTPEQISRAFLDAMREYNSGGNLPGAGGAGGGRSTGPSVGTPAADMGGIIKQVKEYTDKVKKGNGALDSYTRMMQLAGGNYVDVSQQLSSLDKAIAKAKASEDLNTQATLENTRAELAQTAEVKNVNAMMKTFAATTIKSIAAAAPAVGNFVKGLQSGASANELSSGLMTAGVDVANGAAQGLAAGMSGAGSAMAMLPGPAGMAGKAMAVLGPIVGNVASGMSKLAKTGISIMQKEVARTTTVFTNASRSGALFADGMTGMKNAAKDAGLTTEQYSKVLQSNSSALAAAGMGVAEGSLLLGATLKKGGGEMRRELLNLGYNFEEQGELVAETMANMRQSGKALTQGDTAAIADQTRKYAENLRIVSSITGEDAKKKMDQVKAEAQQLAFQQQLAGMDAKERDNIIQAMSMMSDQQRKNFQESLVFGQVINKEGAALESTSSSYAASTQAMVDAAKNGTLDAAKARIIIADSSAGIKKDLLAQKEIGMAGMAGVSGLAGSLNTAMGLELQYRNKWNADAMKKAEDAAKAQKKTDDEVTTTVVDNMKIAQDLAVKTEAELSKLLPLFTDFQNKTLSMTKQLVDAVSGAAQDSKGKNEDGSDKDWVEKQMNKVGLSKQSDENAGVGGALKGAATGAMTGAMVGSLVPVVGTAIGAAVGGIIGGALGWFSKGSSDGGIVTGANEGFLHKLHGTELIVPLDNGKPRESSKGYEHAMNIFGKGSSTVEEAVGAAGKVAKSAWGWAKKTLFGGGDEEEGAASGEKQGGALSALAKLPGPIGAVADGVKAIGSWFGGGKKDAEATASNEKESSGGGLFGALKSIVGIREKDEPGGILDSIVSKVSSVVAEVKEDVVEALGGGDEVRDPDRQAAMADDSPMKAVLDEQLQVLYQLQMHLANIDGTGNETVAYQRTLVENTW